VKLRDRISDAFVDAVGEGAALQSRCQSVKLMAFSLNL